MFPYYHIIGSSLEVFFSIDFQQSVDQPRFVLHASVLNKVERELNARLQGRCEMCDSALLKSSTMEKVFLKTTIKTSESCPLSQLISVLNNLTNNALSYNITLYGQPHIVNVYPIGDNFPEVELVISYLSGLTKCNSPYKYDTTFGAGSCPMVEIERKQFQKWAVNISDISHLLKNSYTENQTTNDTENAIPRLCLDDYFAIVDGLESTTIGISYTSSGVSIGFHYLVCIFAKYLLLLTVSMCI